MLLILTHTVFREITVKASKSYIHEVFWSCLISNPWPVQCRCTDPVNYRLVDLVETDRDGSESSQVVTAEAEHHDCIIFIKVPAEPGGWIADAGPLPPAAVAESRDGAFIFLQGLANCAVQ